LISEAFDRSRITELRHAVAARAQEAGMTGARLDDFVVAVNELLTNAVRHVTDHGTGLEALIPHRPPPDQPGGWGLWLVRELTDTCEIKTGPDGTAVRISSRTDAKS
jgi:serine/threonine-protein kinase RsbW